MNDKILISFVKIWWEEEPVPTYLDRDDGRWHYDFEGFDSEKEYEMEIDATTGEVREHEVD